MAKREAVAPEDIRKQLYTAHKNKCWNAQVIDL